jgi:hypothetical protein
MARGPEQAVLDHIARARPAARARRPAPAKVRGGARRTAGISIGGAPWTAHLDTVRILKERCILGRHVYVVSFDADHLRAGRLPMTMVVRAERTGAGWTARGISAGARVPEPELDAPRVLLGGSWGRLGFCGGGRVCAATPEIERVRLRFGNGIELEDDVGGGWVLFFTDRPVERPAAVVELLDADGAEVASHGWPAGHDLPDALRRRIPLVLTRRA